MIRAGLFPADPQWILWVEILYAMIYDIHLRHSIVGSGQEVVVVKTDLARAGIQLAVPIRPAWPAQAKVPFADDSGRVTGTLE